MSVSTREPPRDLRGVHADARAVADEGAAVDEQVHESRVYKS